MEYGADGKRWPDTTDGHLWAQMWIRRLEVDYPEHSTEMSLARWFAFAIMTAFESAVAEKTRQDTRKRLDEFFRATP